MSTYRELLAELYRMEAEKDNEVKQEETLLQGADGSKGHECACKSEKCDCKKEDGAGDSTDKDAEQAEGACALSIPERGGDRECHDPNHIFEPIEKREDYGDSDGLDDEYGYDSEEKEIVYWTKRLMSDDYDEPEVKYYQVKRFTSSTEDFTFKVHIEQRPDKVEPFEPNKVTLPPNVTIYGIRAYRRDHSSWRSFLLSCFCCFKCLPCVKREKIRKRASRNVRTTV